MPVTIRAKTTMMAIVKGSDVNETLLSHRQRQRSLILLVLFKSTIRNASERILGPAEGSDCVLQEAGRNFDT